MDIEKLKFPIGQFIPSTSYTALEIAHFIETIASLPEKLLQTVQNMTEQQLNTAYRPAGWTVRQVVHHLADSHCNSFIRFKLALTEDKPTIKPYQEQLWAELADSKNASITPSLYLLENLHKKWVLVLQNIQANEWQTKGFIHPEKQRLVTLAEAVALYAWHGEHHLAHIHKLQERMLWKK